MAEENKNANIKEAEVVETKVVDAKSETSKAEVKTEAKEIKKETKKTSVTKKDEAFARGTNLKASKKHCMYICKYIKNKSVDQAIKELEEVVLMKRLIPFKGEIPHKHGKGVMSARYPVASSKEMIYLLKSLKGNILVNGMDLDKTRISFASASWASRPAKRGGMRFKRTFVLIKAKELITGDKK